MPDSEQTLDFPAESCRSCGIGLDRRARFCSTCGTSVIPGEVPAASANTISTRDLADLEYMGFWIRLAAELIDYLFAIIANILLILIADITPFLGVFVVIIDIYILYKYLKCKTPGKKLMKIKVVNANGEDVSFWRGAFRQTFAKLVSLIFFLLGFLWIGWDRQKRGWHDHLAGTFVVRVQPNRPA